MQFKIVFRNKMLFFSVNKIPACLLTAYLLIALDKVDKYTIMKLTVKLYLI